MHSITTQELAAPVSQSERIVIIDSLRGIALLGILMMNMPFFALPYPVPDTLVLRNEWGTINEKVWYFINWFLEGSQRAIFSLLFGAGIILFITRLEKRMSGMMPAEYFLRRQLWLLVFGQLQRYEIYYVVGAVWLLEIIWSHIWLRYFRFGPLEWLWRSLTYWKWQPLKK